MRFPLFLLLLCCLYRPAAAEVLELRIALWRADARESSRPALSQAQVGGLADFNEALAGEICRRINARCLTENVLFADILPGIEARRFDLGFGNFLRTPEREKRVAFSDTIWNSSSRLLVRSDNNHRLLARFGPEISPDKLRDLRVGGVAGTQQYAYLERLAGGRGLTLSSLPTMREAVQRLGDGQLDLCLLPMLSAYDLLLREAPGRFEFIGPPLVDNGLGGTVHIALAKEREPLRQAVNAAIAALRADGTYHRLLRRYFPFNLE